MKITSVEKFVKKFSEFIKFFVLVILFALIAASILLIRRSFTNESEFVDSVPSQIAQEMEENQIVLNTEGGRRTVAEFKEPIIMMHGQESKLIVHTAHLSETISIANEGLGGWEWTSAYQEIEYEGDAQYTVDLSQLSEEDFVVNNELKTLTVRIPYAVLAPINVRSDQIKFHDVQKGWAAPKDITMTPEQNTQLMIQVGEKMKAKLIDENIIAEANESAKSVVKELLSTTVWSVDPEFTVVVVQ